eukprot:15004156-Alexandrium_andersonii.AAC.1
MAEGCSIGPSPGPRPLVWRSSVAVEDGPQNRFPPTCDPRRSRDRPQSANRGPAQRDSRGRSGAPARRATKGAMAK